MLFFIRVGEKVANMNLKRHVVTFRKVVPAGGDSGDGVTPNAMSYKVTSPCTLEEVDIRFYPGVEMALQVDVFIIHQSEMREEVFTFTEGSDKFISGDDDKLTFPVTLSMEPNDTLYVQYLNTNMANAYHLVVDCVLDELGGTDSAR